MFSELSLHNSSADEEPEDFPDTSKKDHLLHILTEKKKKVWESESCPDLTVPFMATSRTIHFCTVPFSGTLYELTEQSKGTTLEYMYNSWKWLKIKFEWSGRVMLTYYLNWLSFFFFPPPPPWNTTWEKTSFYQLLINSLFLHHCLTFSLQEDCCIFTTLHNLFLQEAYSVHVKLKALLLTKIDFFSPTTTVK